MARRAATKRAMCLRPSRPDAAVAIHEAGHAVLAHAFGFAVDRVHVSREDGGHGAATFEVSAGRPGETRAQQLERAARVVAVAIAGAIATDELSAFQPAWSPVDVAKAREVAVWAAGSGADAFLAETEVWCRAIVRQRADAIRAVARELRDRRSLSGPDLAAVIHAAV